MESLRKIKVLLLLLIDIFFINLAYAFSFFIKHSFNLSYEKLDVYISYAPIIVLLYIVPLGFMRMYRSLWRVAGIDEFMRGVIACFLGIIFNLIFMATVDNGIPVMITLMSGIFITVLLIGFRLSFRIYRRMALYGTLLNKVPSSNVLIIGAGACGRLVLTEMKRESGAGFKPVGVIDDNKHKIGTFINGVKVLGDRKYIKEAVEKNNVDLILIAIPSLCSDDKKEIIALCHETKAKVKLMPGLYEMIGGQVNLTKMRDVDLKDLLGREEIKLDKENIKEYINFKRVLVTGGGGSIGSELCRQISFFNPKELIILDIYENNAYELQNELSRVFPNVNQKVIIASVRDKLKIESVFDKYKPEVIFHAAAHKHVPLMEFNPEEAIKNNVIGTLNVAEAASKYGVDKFVLISTDKAVNPTNVMGATKRICEMIIQAINKKSKTEFVAVRFGNVLGSNGSVIPLFKKQIAEGGPVTLTNKHITRYFMLIPEAAQLVLQAGAYAKGGEIFVLDMGKPVKIHDLAKNLIKLSGYEPYEEIDIEITGLRPGEKLYEELLMNEEGLKETPHKKIFIGKPGVFNLEKLKEDINELLHLSRCGDEEELRCKIEKVVPTYFRKKKRVSQSKEEKVTLNEVSVNLN